MQLGARPTRYRNRNMGGGAASPGNGGISRWAFEQRLDGLFLHRYRSLQSEALARLAVVANHDAFDRRFGFGHNAELHALLEVNPLETLGFRHGLPLGTVGAPAASVLLCARWQGLEVRVRRECSAREP